MPEKREELELAERVIEVYEKLLEKCSPVDPDRLFAYAVWVVHRAEGEASELTLHW